MGVIRNFLCAGIVGSSVALAGPAASQNPGSILDGVYTVEQASRGAMLYGKHCEQCHQIDLQGDGLLTPAIGRSAFGTRWSGDTLATVLRFISRIMPYDEAGKLDAQTYSDVLAYMLQFSGYPPGNNEIPTDATALGSMAVERLP